MPIWMKENKNGTSLLLHIQPGASKSEIAGIHGDRLKLKIKSASRSRQNIETESFLRVATINFSVADDGDSPAFAGVNLRAPVRDSPSALPRSKSAGRDHSARARSRRRELCRHPTQSPAVTDFLAGRDFDALERRFAEIFEIINTVEIAVLADRRCPVIQQIAFAPQQFRLLEVISTL